MRTQCLHRLPCLTHSQKKQKRSAREKRASEKGKKREKIKGKKGKSRRGSATRRFTRNRRDLRRWTHRCVLTTLRYCGRFPMVRRAEEVGGVGGAHRSSVATPFCHPRTIRAFPLPTFVPLVAPRRSRFVHPLSIHWIFSGANGYNLRPLSRELRPHRVKNWLLI